MRVYYTTWGKGLVPPSGYALREEWEQPIEAVIRSMERKSGMQRCGGPCNQGTALERGIPISRHWSLTMGRPCKGGGWTPEAEVWVSIS